ncbi:MAG: Autotransporter-associated beta strand repeat protein [Verrucomicrobia bacterium]|nr:Autotransporter-associated beta strand repeat protein [Verrucomicrobiota bacterium]
MKLRAFLTAVALCSAGASGLRAQFVWTGDGANALLTNPANWSGGTAPTGSGAESLDFGVATHSSVTFPAAFSVGNISLTDGSAAYFLGNGTTDLTLNGDVLTSESSDGSLTLNFGTITLSAGSHRFEGDGGPFLLFGSLAGTGTLVKTGLHLLTIVSPDNASTFTGLVSLESGDLAVAGDKSLGTGTLIMNGGRLLVADRDSDRRVTLSNDLLFTVNTASFGDTDPTLLATLFTFTGSATTDIGATLIQMNVAPKTQVTIQGSVGEASLGTQYGLIGGGTVVFGGPANSYTGGTYVEDGVFIFRGNVPSSGLLTARSTGYIGTESTANTQAGFLDLFDKEVTTGIIGFDSPVVGAPQSFAGPIDLTGFGTFVRIGTSTSATLTGLITPQGVDSRDYRFGGRGVLTVTSVLADVSLGSSLFISDGLQLYLTGSNTYSGTTEVGSGGALIFNSSTALSPNTGILVDAQGYVGATENLGGTAAEFLAHFNPNFAYGVIGFDAVNPTAGRIVSDNIDLSSFASSFPFLGTSTAATLTGVITPNGFQYRFTGFREGHLTVDSVLADIDGVPVSVVIGLYAGDIMSQAAPGTVFQPSVTLRGNNTYTGTTYLQSGELILGSANALGTSTLEITSFNPAPAGLSVTTDGLVIPNNIDFSDYENDLFTLGGSHDFTLAGNMTWGNTGYRIFKAGNNTITLSGDNRDLYMDFTVRDGTLVFGSDTAAGNGLVGLINRAGGGGGIVRFTSSAPALGSLAGESATAVDLAFNGTLTINQDNFGVFAGVISGTGGIVKRGFSDLELTGTNVYTGGTEIADGRLVIRGGSISHPGANLTVAAGSESSGQVEIVEGAQVSDLQGLIAGGTYSSATVTVDGAGSTWNNGDTLTMAPSISSDALLSISHGGTVTSSQSYVGQGGDATAVLTDPGSTWTTADEMIVGGFDSNGNGSLTVSNGAVATSARGSIGYVAHGTVTVTDAGSAWNNSGRLYVGSAANGYGQLEIFNGGVVTSSTGEVGLDAGSIGDVTLLGAGSRWDLTGNLDVGNSGIGVLRIFRDAQLNVAGGAGIINLGANSGGDGTLVIGQSEGGYNGGILNASAINGGSGSNAEIRFDVGSDSSAPFYLTKNGLAGGTPVQITGSVSVVNSFGFNVLAGTNTYSGGTFLQGGTLVAGSNSALGTGLIHFQGGELSVASGVTLTTPLDLTGGGTLGGNGAFGSNVILGGGTGISPGNSPGLLTFTAGLTWAPGGFYDIEVQSALGARGVGYDSINVTGGLAFTATLGSPFTLNLISLDTGANPGAVSDFSATSGYSWLIAHSDGLTGFNAANISINTASFTNSLGATGQFNVSAVGNDIYLNFSPVPEPSTYALMGAGLVVLAAQWRRKRRA